MVFGFQFDGYANSTVGGQPLDFKSLLEAGWELYDVIIRLRSYFDSYEPVIERLMYIDLSKVFDSVKGLLAPQAGQNFTQAQAASTE